MRRRWQIHLSTAVVLMVVAGGLLWANFADPVCSGARDAAFAEEYFGWPVEFSRVVFLDEKGAIIKKEWPILHCAVGWAILTDLAVALSILFNVAVVSEWAIWRESECWPQRRVRDRIHWGTIGAMVCVACVLLWLNFRDETWCASRVSWLGRMYGWPLEIRRREGQWVGGVRALMKVIVVDLPIWLSFLMNAWFLCDLIWRPKKVKNIGIN